MILTDLLIAPYRPEWKFVNKTRIKSGYVKLVSSNKIYDINEMIKKILKHEETLINNYDCNEKTEDRNIRELLLHNLQWESRRFFGFHGLVASFSLAKELEIALCYPLKKNWHNLFITSGSQLNKFVCGVMWNITVLQKMVSSQIKCLQFLIHAFKKNTNIAKIKNVENEKFLYIPNLLNGHFSEHENATSFNFINWLKYNRYPNQKLNILHSNKSYRNCSNLNESVELTYIDLKWRWNNKPLKDFFLRARLLLKIQFKYILSTQRKLSALHQFDIFQAEYIENQLPNIIEYVLFDQSRIIDKPLWATYLEKKNVSNILFFYALAAEPAWDNGEEFFPSYWLAAQWKEFWAIDQIQKDKIIGIRTEPEPNIKIIGVPYWIDSPIKPNKITNSISLFDSEPQKNMFFLSNIIGLGLYEKQFYKPFFQDILERAKFYDFRILHKSKRSTGKRIEGFYDEILNEIRSKYKNHYSIIDYSVSPQKLLSNSIGSISQPISTVALISKALHLPTIFYDPMQCINVNDKEVRGIFIANSTKKLDDWFQDLRKEYA